MNFEPEPFEDDEIEWKQSASGNYVLIYGGELLATVYKARKSRAWCIIINRDHQGYFVDREGFDDCEDACDRAEAIVSGGAECDLVPIQGRGY